MNNIKTYIIGFLSCACLLLIVGWTQDDGEVGRYQVVMDSYDATGDGKDNLAITHIDTKTGKYWSWSIFSQEWKEYPPLNQQK